MVRINRIHLERLNGTQWALEINHLEFSICFGTQLKRHTETLSIYSENLSIHTEHMYTILNLRNTQRYHIYTIYIKTIWTNIYTEIHWNSLRKLTYMHRLFRQICARSFWTNKSRQGPPLYGGVYTSFCVTLCGVGKGRRKAPVYAAVHRGS